MTVGTLTRHDHAGAISIPITRIAAAKRLTPGVYRIRSVLHDSSGHTHTFVMNLQLLAARGSPTAHSRRVATLHARLTGLF